MSDKSYYENNPSCLYCKHNHNTERNTRIVCQQKFEQECNSINKFLYEPCSKERKEFLDKVVEEIDAKNKNYAKKDALSTAIVISYFSIFALSAILLFIFTLKIRFNNPALTETQIFLELINNHGLLCFTTIFLMLLPTIIKFFYKG